jgi:hypothetical protein
MICVMTDLTAGPGPDADTESPAGEARDWGRALDAAGIIAGVLLIVIVADIMTDGRLVSRRLLHRNPEAGDPGDSPAE